MPSQLSLDSMDMSLLVVPCGLGSAATIESKTLPRSDWDKRVLRQTNKDPTFPALADAPPMREPILTATQAEARMVPRVPSTTANPAVSITATIAVTH